MLLSSGYIAGGTLIGLVLAFFVFLGDEFNNSLNLGLQLFGEDYVRDNIANPKIVAVIMFAVLAAVLVYIGTRIAGIATNASSKDRFMKRLLFP